MSIRVTDNGQLQLSAVQPRNAPVTVDPGDVTEIADAVFMGLPCARVTTPRGASYVLGPADEIRRALAELRAIDGTAEGGHDSTT